MAAELLVEIFAADRDEDPDAQQSFYALAFPARHGSEVIKHLTTEFGSLVNAGFGHLKRMKKHPEKKGELVALITPATTSDGEERALDSAKASEMAEKFGGVVCLVDVLKKVPRTREAWDIHTRNWPLIFHACVVPEVESEVITNGEAEKMKYFVMRARQCRDQLLAARGGVNPYRSCCSLGCVIVDPQGTDGRVAEEVVDSLTSAENPEYAFHAIFHPVMIAIDGVAGRDRERGDAPGPPKRQCRVDIRDGDDNSATPSYLCTGYDIYLDREPCAMCAMALIHSRARRVIFSETNPTNGALTTAHRLHTIKSLNHHYRAFRMHVEQ